PMLAASECEAVPILIFRPTLLHGVHVEGGAKAAEGQATGGYRVVVGCDGVQQGCPIAVEQPSSDSAAQVPGDLEAVPFIGHPGLTDHAGSHEAGEGSVSLQQKLAGVAPKDHR